MTLTALVAEVPRPPTGQHCKSISIRKGGGSPPFFHGYEMNQVGAVSFDDVYKTYAKQLGESAYVALTAASFRLGEGKTLGMIGPKWGWQKHLFAPDA